MTTWQEIDRAIDDVVRECLESAQIDEPPVDPVLVAEALEVHAQIDAALPGRGERRSINGRSVILIRPDERPEREQFALAHEIGEEVAVKILAERLDLMDPTDRWREELANRFAGRLLCPTRWLKDAVLRFGDNLLKLKPTFSTASHEVIARQMLTLDVPTVITVIDNGAVQLRIGNVPHGPAMSALEEKTWNRCHTTASTIDLATDGLRVQGWPIHEHGWQREIVRTTRLDL